MFLLMEQSGYSESNLTAFAGGSQQMDISRLFLLEHLLNADDNGGEKTPHEKVDAVRTSILSVHRSLRRSTLVIQSPLESFKPFSYFFELSMNSRRTHHDLTFTPPFPSSLPRLMSSIPFSLSAF